MILQGSRAPRAVSILLWSTPSTQNNQVFSTKFFHFLEAVGFQGSWKKNEWMKSKPMMWNLWAHWLIVSKTFLPASSCGEFYHCCPIKGWGHMSGLGNQICLKCFSPHRRYQCRNYNEASVCLWSHLGSKTEKGTTIQSPLFLFKVWLSWLYYRLDSFVTINCALQQQWAKVFNASAHRFVLKVNITWKYFTFTEK